MTEDKRQELRDKHKANNKQYCSFCYQRLTYGTDKGLTTTPYIGSGLTTTPYPCDVIKVLDAWEGK